MRVLEIYACTYYHRICPGMSIQLTESTDVEHRCLIMFGHIFLP